jgi:hypothetical protein
VTVPSRFYPYYIGKDVVRLELARSSSDNPIYSDGEANIPDEILMQQMTQYLMNFQKRKRGRYDDFQVEM